MKNLATESREHILTIFIDREEKMNALNLELLSELDDLLNEAEKDPGLRGIIITGKGTKAFAAGADIAEFAGFTKDKALKMSEKGHQLFNRIESFPKPVIAAVN